MSLSEHFSLTQQSDGHWIIRHTITGLLAGRVIETSGGFLLSGDDSRAVGIYDTMDDAVTGLSATTSLTRAGS